MMKNLQTSYSSGYKRVQDLPVYKKAIEIFTISRELVRLVSGDKNILDLNSSRERSDRISSSMLAASLGLAPRIAMVESSIDPSVRLSSLKYLQQETGMLLKYCEQMEQRNKNSRAFILRLKQELKQFSTLQGKWVGRLRELN